MKLNYNNGFDQDEIDLANSAPDLASLLIWDFYPEQVGETYLFIIFERGALAVH